MAAANVYVCGGSKSLCKYTGFLYRYGDCFPCIYNTGNAAASTELSSTVPVPYIKVSRYSLYVGRRPPHEGSSRLRAPRPKKRAKRQKERKLGKTTARKRCYRQPSMADLNTVDKNPNQIFTKFGGIKAPIAAILHSYYNRASCSACSL